MFCVFHTPSYKDTQTDLSHTPDLSSIFHAALNDAFPVASLSEPEGAPATVLLAYKYIHTMYALNTCTHKREHCALRKMTSQF